MGLTKIAIRDRLGGRLIGKETMKGFVVETLQKLPEELLTNLTKKVWFVSSFEDAWGFVLKGDELKDKHLIFLSDELFSEPKEQIHYTILHEIGHVVLNHRNSILAPQSKRETESQERAADSFAKEYL
jgi:Zn-dependent peptidase ImmA (M78 family)